MEETLGEFGKIVRWAAPGSVFILLAIGFASLWHAFLSQNVWPVKGPSRDFPVPDLSGGLVALLFGASVPLGFLIYQLYYYGYTRPRPFVLSFVHLDVAQRVQERLSTPLTTMDPLEWQVKKAGGLFLRWPRHVRIPLTGAFSSLWLFVPPEGASGNPPGASRSEDGDVPPAMPGVDVPLTVRYLQSTESASKQKAVHAYNEVLNAYSRKRENNWLKLESRLHGTLRGTPGSEQDFRDIERLADVYHTLGAARLPSSALGLPAFSSAAAHSFFGGMSRIGLDCWHSLSRLLSCPSPSRRFST